MACYIVKGVFVQKNLDEENVNKKKKNGPWIQNS
jgi:hypothetical protein